MKPQSSQYVLGIAVGFVPDLVVCWAVARLTDSGWYGFFISMISLQIIYSFFWLKNAIWSWFVFWIYLKEKIAAHCENLFVDSHFPIPEEYTTDLDDYLNEVSNNNTLDTAVRVKAAHELGTLTGLRSAQAFSLFLQVHVAARIAMKRYARFADRLAQ